MPLTQVVEYLNERLHQLHPAAGLRKQAGFRYRNGVLTAGVASFRLRPEQVPVVRAIDGERVAYSARCFVETGRGHPVRAEALYVQAWDPEDVVFLDRFLRVFHALHHLGCGHEPGASLALDVHLRHVSAVPEQHGQVFEDLLARLGLIPSQILLRLDGRALQRDPHVQDAALSFARRGYRLVATRPDFGETDWELLHRIGVRWVLQDVAALRGIRDQGVLNDWLARAEAQGLGIWLDKIAHPSDLTEATAFGAELVEGDRFRDPVSVPTRAPTRAAF